MSQVHIRSTSCPITRPQMFISTWTILIRWQVFSPCLRQVCLCSVFYSLPHVPMDTSWTPHGLCITCSKVMIIPSKSCGVPMESSWSPWSPHRVPMESSWNPCGVLMESMESPWSPHGVLMESLWSPHGVHVESLWSPCGVPMESSSSSETIF